jgi:hypothetical protein
MSRPGAFALAAAVIVLAAPAARAASVLSAQADCAATGGCFEAGSSTYKQVWKAGGVSGPVDVGALLLDRRILGAWQDQLFKVSFRLADGTRVGDWGAFMIAGLNGEMVRLSGPGFTWDSSLGDLEMTLELAFPSQGAGGGGFPGQGGPFGGDAFPGRGGPFSSGAPLADPPPFDPPFNLPPTSVLAQAADPDDVAALAAEPLVGVPEPGAWALMLLGFGMAGALLRHGVRPVARLQPQR